MIEISFIFFSFILCFLITLYAGLYDLKTSDVYEEVPALLISFGLFYWFIISLVNGNFAFFLNSVLIGSFFLALGLLLYQLKVWGDGDAWVLGGIGFLVPFLPTPFLFYPLSFVFNVLIVGGIYSMIYIIGYGIIKESVRETFISEIRKHALIYFGFIFTCVLISYYVQFFLIVGLFPIIYIYTKVVEKGMKRKIKVSELKEGDVLVGGEICGLKKEEIEKLKKTKKYVDVQEGVRFTIVFPITLLFLYYFGGFFGLLLF